MLATARCSLARAICATRSVRRSRCCDMPPWTPLLAGDDEDFFARAESARSLEPFLMALCGRPDMEYLVREAALALSRFASAHRSALRDYSHGVASLAETAVCFSRFLESEQSNLPPEAVRAAIGGFNAEL